MTAEDHLEELAALRPLVIQLRHDLAIERRHRQILADECRQLRRELEIIHRKQPSSDFEPQDPGTRTIGGRA